MNATVFSTVAPHFSSLVSPVVQELVYSTFAQMNQISESHRSFDSNGEQSGVSEELYYNCTVYDNQTCPASNKSATPIPPKYETWEVVLIATLTAITAVITVLGNILVLISFLVERTLRQPSNYFIASLAVTDLLIGLFSMPAYSTYLILGRWPFPDILCDLWLSLDYTVCLVSQYNVLLITIDRFCSVKIPAKYRNWRAKRKVQIMVVSTWIIPMAIFFTIHLGWDTFMGRRLMSAGGCDAQYIKANPMFNVLLIFGYFWLTMVVLLGLYAGIYQTAFTLQRKSQAKHDRMQQMVRLTTSDGGKTTDTTKQTAGLLAVHTKKLHIANDVSVVFNSTTVTGKQTVDTSVEATSPVKPNDGSGSSEQDRSSSPTFPSDAEQPEEGGTAEPNTGVPLSRKPPAKGGTTARPHHHVFRDLKERVAQRQRPRGKFEVVVPKIPAPPKQMKFRQRHSQDDDKKPPNLIDFALSSDKKPHTLPLRSAISRSLPTVDVGKESYDQLKAPYVSQPAINTATLQTILLAKELNDEIRLLFAQRAPDIRVPFTSTAGLQAAEEPDAFIEPVWIPRVPFPVRFDELPSVLLQPFTGRTPLNSSNDWRYIDQESLKSPNSSMEGTQTSTPTNRSSINSPLINRSVSGTPPKEAASRSITRGPSPVPPSSTNTESPSAPNNSPDTNGKLPSIGLKLARPAPKISVRPEISDIGEESTRCDSDQRSLNLPDSDQTTVANHIGPGPLDQRINSERFRQLGKRLREVATRSSKRKSLAKRQQSKSENRARKALKTITFIMGAFVLCWTPWHICATIEGFCNGCVNPSFYALSYWLCYLNSPINPFCYALANQQFKKTFIRVLKFDLHRT